MQMHIGNVNDKNNFVGYVVVTVALKSTNATMSLH